jgi:hypothetical protein
VVSGVLPAAQPAAVDVEGSRPGRGCCARGVEVGQRVAGTTVGAATVAGCGSLPGSVPVEAGRGAVRGPGLGSPSQAQLQRRRL